MNDILEKLYSLDPAISTLHKKYGILKAEREREKAREGNLEKNWINFPSRRQILISLLQISLYD